MLPTWSGHSTLGVDKLASLLENPSLVGIHHSCTKRVDQWGKDVDHSPRFFQIFQTQQETVWHDSISLFIPIFNLPVGWILRVQLPSLFQGLIVWFIIPVWPSSANLSCTLHPFLGYTILAPNWWISGAKVFITEGWSQSPFLSPLIKICKVAFCISCNKRKLYCMLSSCFLSDISGTRNSLKLPKVRIVMSARRLPPFPEIFNSIYHFRSCGN